MNNIYKKLGVKIPEILLPAEGTDLTKWAVIACDQYTSQPDYWQQVQENADQSPSTLKLIFPEIFLKEDDCNIRVNNINKTMEQYLKQGVLQPQKPGFILVDRSTPHTASRKGLILAVDLECYDYSVGSQSLIRATEGTVLDRIPPRVKIRENAPIELPHIMVLIDDPKKTVIESLYARKDNYRKLYDFDLMQGGGHIRGWKVEDDESLSLVSSALVKLLFGDVSPNSRDVSFTSEDISSNSGDVSSNSGDVSPKPMLFAMGDGNHSLASAKAHWENVKATINQQNQIPRVHSANAQTADARTTDAQSADVWSADARTTDAQSADAASSTIPEHPARYALVELVNVHDDGLAFEPIHRVVFGINAATIQDQLIKAAQRLQLNAEVQLFDSKKAMTVAWDTAMEAADADMKKTAEGGKTAEGCITATGGKTAEDSKAAHRIPIILEGTYGLLTVKNPVSSLEVGSLQSILDELVKNSIETGKDKDLEIDYIHGDQVVTELGSKVGSIGFFLPVMNKHDLFRTVKADGVLPRKTFSMGEAEEKRYYLECRRII